MWGFAAYLLLAHSFPSHKILLGGFYGGANSLTTALLSSWVGGWIDRNQRLSRVGESDSTLLRIDIRKIDGKLRRPFANPVSVCRLRFASYSKFGRGHRRHHSTFGDEKCFWRHFAQRFDHAKPAHWIGHRCLLRGHVGLDRIRNCHRKRLGAASIPGGHFNIRLGFETVTQ